MGTVGLQKRLQGKSSSSAARCYPRRLRRTSDRWVSIIIC
jgi:hypothetical protein